MVKKFIPGGSKAGAGKVPGTPAEEELSELFKVDWGEAKETAKGLGADLLEKMEKENDEKQSNWDARIEIWEAALEMCETDKAAFKKEVMATHNTIKHMTKQVEFSVEAPTVPDSKALK
jgi:polyhydroxyalkanoate synthesis regulator phasin